MAMLLKPSSSTSVSVIAHCGPCAAELVAARGSMHGPAAGIHRTHHIPAAVGI